MEISEGFSVIHTNDRRVDFATKFKSIMLGYQDYEDIECTFWWQIETSPIYSRKAAAEMGYFHPQLIFHLTLLSNSIWTGLPVVESVFINLPSMAACELLQHLSATEGCARTFFTQQILMSHILVISRKSLIPILKTATAVDNNSVIGMSTNSLQMRTYHG